MTITQIPGIGPQIWYPTTINNAPTLANSAPAIAATGDKTAFCGRVWTPTRGSKSIERIGYRYGSGLVKAGGSGHTVSLQDVSLTAGPPMQPDGTPDQTVAVAAADQASSTWIRTGTLSANRTVAPGGLLAVVVEFDGGGRLGADSFTLSGLNDPAVASGLQGAACVTSVSGVWALSTNRITPNVILEMSDGTFGTLLGSIPCSLVNTHAFKQDTGTADEFALAFQVPFACKVDGMYLPFLVAANTSDFSFILYDGTTPMTGGTIAVDANAIRQTTVGDGLYPFSQEITLAANTQYYLSMQPTQTTSTVTCYSLDVSDANHLTCHSGGTAFNYSTRLDAGSWAAATSTRRLFAGLSISSLDDGTGIGGMVVPATIHGMGGLYLG